MRLIIDRFEGDFAIVELENGETVDISKKIIPDNVIEGDVIDITVNKEETKKIKEIIEKLCEDLWE